VGRPLGDRGGVVTCAPTAGSTHHVQPRWRCWAFDFGLLDSVPQLVVLVTCDNGNPVETAWDCADDADEAAGPCPVCADMLTVTAVGL